MLLCSQHLNNHAQVKACSTDIDLGYWGGDYGSTSNPGLATFSYITVFWRTGSEYLFSRMYGDWSNGTWYDMMCSSYCYSCDAHGYDFCSWNSRSYNQYTSLHNYRFTSIEVWTQGNGYINGMRWHHTETTQAALWFGSTNVRDSWNPDYVYTLDGPIIWISADKAGDYLRGFRIRT